MFRVTDDPGEAVQVMVEARRRRDRVAADGGQPRS
jgi:hypothetical protein